jgi:hypothetical protein
VSLAGQAPLTGDEAALLSRAAAMPGLAWPGCTSGPLARLAETDGLDLATAVFFDRAHQETIRSGFAGQVAAGTKPGGLDTIAVVPGAFHGQHKHTGADGLRIVDLVRDLAPDVQVIPILSFGRLEENADTILDWLEARPGARILLTSLSKGGADVKWALRSPRAAAAFASVVGWVSFSGIVQGTPLMGWLRARPLRSAAFRLLLRLQGHQAGVLDEIAQGDDRPLAAWPALPPHLRIVHVCGCPLRRHLAHRWAPRGYERLAPLGPNDGGGILLGDLTGVPGTVFPIWGADHYLQPAWNVIPLLRDVVAATATLGVVRDASQSASQPSPAPAARSSA